MPPPYETIPPTPLITPLPTTTFGRAFDNLTQSNFSILYFPKNAFDPYTWPTMGNYAIPTFLILLFLYYGMWVTHKNVRLASVVGILFGGGMLVSTGGLGISIPIEAIAISYGALVASIAGLIMSCFKAT